MVRNNDIIYMKGGIHMFQPNLIQTETPEITVIPTRILLKVRDLLDKRKITYRVISKYDLPDGAPSMCTFLGKEHRDFIYGIECCVTRESLLKAAEDLYHVSPNEIA